MSLILNIDTATESAQVNFSKDGMPVLSVANNSQKDHASFLQVAIQQLVRETGIALSTLDAVAVTAGPGSYTGLRVGMASAKGLCYALNKPLITLNTLEVLTVAALQQTQLDDEILFCPMIDARRMEVFTALYNKKLKTNIEPCAMILDGSSFVKQLQEHKILFFGNGYPKWKQVCGHPNASFEDITISSLAIGSLSYERLLQKQFAGLAYTEPIYLKEFEDSKKG